MKKIIAMFITCLFVISTASAVYEGVDPEAGIQGIDQNHRRDTPKNQPELAYAAVVDIGQKQCQRDRCEDIGYDGHNHSEYPSGAY